MDYQKRFSFISERLPDPPDTLKYLQAIQRINRQRQAIYDLLDSSLYNSGEPKVIIKIPATQYQKSKFGENFTFAFQSLVTGRKSTFIKLSDRPQLGILEVDKINGGIFPTELALSDNLETWLNHYSDISKKVFAKQSELLQDYYYHVSEVKGEWWALYQEYLASQEWKIKREQRLRIDGYRCIFSCSSQELHVHHIHYSNVGNENMDDLITVCKDCHSLIHKRKL
jgi:hypothetical protein